MAYVFTEAPWIVVGLEYSKYDTHDLEYRAQNIAEERAEWGFLYYKCGQAVIVMKGKVKWRGKGEEGGEGEDCKGNAGNVRVTPDIPL